MEQNILFNMYVFRIVLMEESSYLYQAPSNVKSPYGIKNSHKIGKIEKICASVDDILVVSEGRLFVYGENRCGTLGIQGSADKLTQVHISNLEIGARVVDVNRSHTASYVVVEGLNRPIEMMSV